MTQLRYPVPSERAEARTRAGELEGNEQTILIGAREGLRAQALLIAHPAVRSAATRSEGILVTLRLGFPMTAEEAAADINRFLIEAGLAVHRVEPARTRSGGAASGSPPNQGRQHE